MNALWIIFVCYGFVCLVWASYAVYKNMTAYSIKPSWWLNVITFLLNFVAFPYAWYYAKKHNKL